MPKALYVGISHRLCFFAMVQPHAKLNKGVGRDLVIKKKGIRARRWTQVNLVCSIKQTVSIFKLFIICCGSGECSLENYVGVPVRIGNKYFDRSLMVAK